MGLERMNTATINDSESAEIDNRVMYLVWEGLTVMVSNLGNGTTRKLLHELSGYAKAGRIMAIMGPSGSGKTTLLDSLAGRLSSSVIMSGKVLLKGRKKGTDCVGISYSTQEDFLGTLTVKETITYSAHLRLTTKMTKEEINKVVEKTIMEMGLEDCADKRIGNWHSRGISGGEKKRLSVGMEILTRPYVMYLDEPTSGLDSASAFFVMRALKNIAHDGRIVVCSIHQPSSYLFDLFDDLFLLSSGEAVYFGEAKEAVKFFAEAGFPCPTKRSPSDHFLRCINSDFDNIAAALMRTKKNCGIPASSNSPMNLTTTEIKAKLVEKYENSIYEVHARNKIQEITHLEGLLNVSNKSNANWWKQLCTLTHRSFINMTRDMGYYWLRMLFYILVSLTAGSVYFNVGLSNLAIIARTKCDAFIYGFMMCLSIGGLPFFIEELKVSNRERVNGHYGEAVFVLSNFISSFPFLVVISISSGTIIYHMVKLHPGFSRYSYFCMNLFCCISVLETCLMTVALLVPNLLMGILTGTGVTVLMMMGSGIIRLEPDLPKFFWRYPLSYISSASWAIQGEYKNDMIGLEFEPLIPGYPKLKGETILRTMFGVQLNHSKWWDLAALMCLLLSNRVLFYLVLKYKEKALSLQHRLYRLRFSQHLASSKV